MWIELTLAYSGRKQLIPIESIVTFRESKEDRVATDVFVRDLQLAVEYDYGSPELKVKEVEIILTDTPYHEIKFLILASQKQVVEKKKSPILLG